MNFHIDLGEEPQMPNSFEEGAQGLLWAQPFEGYLHEKALPSSAAESASRGGFVPHTLSGLSKT